MPFSSFHQYQREDSIWAQAYTTPMSAFTGGLSAGVTYIPPFSTIDCRALAVETFRAVDAAGMARVDFFLEGDDRIYVNEINTIPGFTSTSGYAKMWEATGLDYPSLIDRLVELAIERHAAR